MNTAVVVAASASARFFLVEPRPEQRPITAHVHLTEVERLTDDRAVGKRNFALHFTDEIADFTRSQNVAKVVFAAEPHLLERLSDAVDKALPTGTKRVDVAEDLSWQTPEHILEALIRHSAL